MVGEQGRLFVECALFVHLDRLSDRRVNLRPARLELAGVGDFLRQRVFEPVFGNRVKRALVHEIAALEPIERGSELVRRQSCDHCQ